MAPEAFVEASVAVRGDDLGDEVTVRDVLIFILVDRPARRVELDLRRAVVAAAARELASAAARSRTPAGALAFASATATSISNW